MTRDHDRVDSTFPEALVDMILEIRREVERGRLRTGDVRQYGPHLGVDAAGSISDLDAVPNPVGPTPFAGDGGDYRFTARETDEGLLVVGDFRGVAASGQETEINLGEDALILTIDGRIVSRVPIDGGWTTITDVSVNNEVLEVRVRIGE